MSVHEFEIAEPQDALAGCVVAIGVFDGVHAGHRRLIEGALEDARERGTKCAILTFDRDPDEVFSRGGFAKIMSNSQRVEALVGLPVDDVFVLEFSPELAGMEPGDFLDGVFRGNAPASIHVGADFRFGKGASGDERLLESWGREHGVDVLAEPIFEIDGAPVKSTAVRRMLGEGNVAGAAKMLGHRYTIVGEVQRGRGDGTGMGFATANLFVPDDERVLADGVYGAYAVVDGERYKAAVSVGIPPMFEEGSVANVEVHVLDFEGNLYGKRIAVEFAEYLRPMMRFESMEELIATVEGDIGYVRRSL